jgi:hypothetical protein
MIVASCHCGSVQLEIEAAPATVTDCNCTICRRYGVLWAYYEPSQVRISPESATETYIWGDRSLAFHRCRVCGCVSHWMPVAGRDFGRMGVNARLLAPEVLAAARLRHLDGAVTERYID